MPNGSSRLPRAHLPTPQYGWSPERLRQDIESFAGLGLKVAITEADVRTFVNNATDQVPTDNLAPFAQANEYSEMLKAALYGAPQRVRTYQPRA